MSFGEVRSTAGVSTAKVIAFVSAIVVSATTYLTIIYTQYTDLIQRFNNDDPFPPPHGSWPRATTDLSNGHLRADGTLNWHVKTS
jgi:hypothetical protein